MRVYDHRGQEVALGAKLGAGGEGDVFAVTGPRMVAAKIYHQALANEKAAKLGHMASLVTPELTELSAWPIDLLHDKPGGRVVGLLMPKVEDHEPIHFLYGPKSRLQKFPDARWPFLIHTAINMCRAFRAIHNDGHVVGDVNHGNLFVSRKATVRFIDCDSFQINARGFHYLCEVGVSTHTPPELQGVPFRSTRRTPNHDAFGMAVLIFQLLFMGRHPFSGSFTGRGDMPIEQAIKEGRFAYGAGAASRHMRPPPGSLPLEAVGPAGSLFERAFVTSPGHRPDASDWIQVLSELMQSLATCGANPAHQHLKSLAGCPWCTMERAAGFKFFPSVIQTHAHTGQSFDLARIWQQIGAVRMSPVPPAPGPESHSVSVSAPIRRAASRNRARKVTGWGIALAAVIIGSGVGAAGFWLAVAGAIAGAIVGNTAESEAFTGARLEHKVAMDNYQQLKKRWDNAGSPESLELKKTHFTVLKYEYERLPERRREAIARLEADRRGHQQNNFLSRFRVETATIEGFGYSRKTTLQSFGIETAADVDREKILAIPGFGPSLTNKIVEWRDTLARNFAFNPNKGVNPSLISQVEADIVKRKFELETALLKAPVILQEIVTKADHQRNLLRPQIEAAALRLAQSTADMTVVTS